MVPGPSLGSRCGTSLLEALCKPPFEPIKEVSKPFPRERDAASQGHTSGIPSRAMLHS